MSCSSRSVNGRMVWLRQLGPVGAACRSSSSGCGSWRSRSARTAARRAAPARRRGCAAPAPPARARARHARRSRERLEVRLRHATAAPPRRRSAPAGNSPSGRALSVMPMSLRKRADRLLLEARLVGLPAEAAERRRLRSHVPHVVRRARRSRPRSPRWCPRRPLRAGRGRPSAAPAAARSSTPRRAGRRRAPRSRSVGVRSE